MKRLSSGTIVAIGVLGTFASVIALPDTPVRTAITVLFAVLVFIGVASLLLQEIDLVSAWSILTQCKHLGIRRIHNSGVSTHLDRMASAKNIRIMAVSGSALVKHRKAEIVSALRDQRAYIQILLAQPNSQFVLDVEKVESPHRLGQISPEICSVERLLYEFAEAASSGRRIDEIGRIEIGYYTTQLRSSLILCDDDWGWLTLNLPPKRAVQSVSLELSQANNGLLRDCIDHFERCWGMVEECGQSFQVLPKHETLRVNQTTQ